LVEIAPSLRGHGRRLLERRRRRRAQGNPDRTPRASALGSLARVAARGALSREGPQRLKQGALPQVGVVPHALPLPSQW